MKVAVVTVRASSGEQGGAERLFDALVQSFADLGHEAEEICLHTDESTSERILENYLYFHDLDLSSFDLVVSTKAPTWMVHHERHVCFLMHTIRAFYDMFDELFPRPTTELQQQRELIHLLDSKALARCQSIDAIGHEVAQRLRRWNGLESGVLHPPLWKNPFRSAPSEPFLFLPGRLHSWKRTDLVVRAMRHVKSPVRLLLAGTGEAEDELRGLTAGDTRVELLGRVSDSDLVDYYSRCFAVPFTPKREDYGFVTLEAFASGKPVITCNDSGEAGLIVREQQAGIVCEPTPESIAAAIDEMYEHPGERAEMGERGRAWVVGLDWRDIARKLIERSGVVVA
jgi:glycosyltransferase involved in cell wall biosynthesis